MKTHPDVELRQAFYYSISKEELLEGFWGDGIGDMIAGFFILCHFSGKMQQWQIRYLLTVNFSPFSRR